MSAASTDLMPADASPTERAGLPPYSHELAWPEGMAPYALELKRLLVPGARVSIIRAGYMGLEVAAAAAAGGCVVTVLEFQDRLMSRVTAEPVSRYFEQLHGQHGVRFLFSPDHRCPQP